MLPTLVIAAVTLSQSPITTTGYFESRTTGAVTKLDGAPALTELVDGNVQLKFVPTKWLTMQVDASLTWQGAAFIRGGNRDLTAYRPQAVVAEAYADFTATEHLRFLIGKKRIVWGPGLAFNPTDVINPPKDPTDPTAQRGGAWVALVEAPFKRFTLSAVFAARATRQFAGLPTALLFDPPVLSAEAAKGWVPDTRDDEPHFAAAARVYALIADTDLTLSYSFTHLYADARTTDSRIGLSGARSFGDLELHAELAGFLGSTSMVVTDGCAEAPLQCVARGVALVTRPRLEARWLNARVLVGARYQFSDSSMLAGEYFFNGDGHDPDGFRALAALARSQPALVQAALGASTDPGTPQRFTFEPLRRHYFTLSYSKPRIFDDFTLTASALISLEDLSMQLVPQVQWQPKEWLLLSLAAYLPLPGVPDWGVELGDEKLGELAISSFGSRFVFSARAFY